MQDLGSGRTTRVRLGQRSAVAFALAGVLTLVAPADVSAQTQFSELTKLNLSNPQTSDAFGTAVAIDGNTLIVGMPGLSSSAGTARIYVRGANGAWALQQSLFGQTPGANYGKCVGVSVDTVIVGAAEAGEESAFIYTRNGTLWTQQARLTSNTAGAFGRYCGISGDSAIVSAPNEGVGAVYIHKRNGTLWTEQARLTAIDPVPGVGFGEAGVTIEGDTAVVGVPGSESGAGSVQVFVRNGTVWTPQQKVSAINGFGGDLLGWSVAINADTIVAGAINRNGSGSFTGAAIVFTRAGQVERGHTKFASRLLILFLG